MLQQGVDLSLDRLEGDQLAAAQDGPLRRLGGRTVLCECIAGDQSGGYFVDCRRTAPSARAQDLDAARRLWALSEAQVGTP